MEKNVSKIVSGNGVKFTKLLINFSYIDLIDFRLLTSLILQFHNYSKFSGCFLNFDIGIHCYNFTYCIMFSLKSYSYNLHNCGKNQFLMRSNVMEDLMREMIG